MEISTFILTNVPELEDKSEYLTDLLEAILDENVNKLEFHPQVPERVLVVMEKALDIRQAAKLLANEHVEGSILKVEPPECKNVVIADGEQIIERLSSFFLKLYFQSEFADGDEIVSAVKQIPMTSMLAVCFTTDQVTKQVLANEMHTPLIKEKYNIMVRPFYFNFHGYIPCQDKRLCQVLEEMIENYRSDCQKQFDTRRNQSLDTRRNQSWTTKQDQTLEVKQNQSNYKVEATAKLGHNLNKNHNDVNIDLNDSEKDTRQHVVLRNIKQIRTSEPQKRGMERVDSKEEGKYEKEQSGKALMEINSNFRSKDEECASSHVAFEKQIKPALKESHSFDMGRSQEESQNSRIGAASKYDEKSRSSTGSDFSLNCKLKKSEWRLLKDKIKRKNNTIDYDETKEVLFVCGNYLSKFMSSFHKLQGHVIHEFLVIKGDDMSRFLSGTYAKERLTYGLKEVQWCIEDAHIHICGLDSTSVVKLKNKIEYIQSNFIKISFENFWDSEYVRWHKDSLEKHFPVCIIFDAKQIVISGVEDDVNTAQVRFEKTKELRRPPECIEENIRRKTISVDMPESCYELMMKHFKREFDENFKHIQYSVNSEKDKIIMEVSGVEDAVDKAQKDLNIFQNAIRVDVIDVSKELGMKRCDFIIKMLSSQTDNSLSDAQNKFEHEQKCLVQNILKKDYHSPISAMNSKTRAGNEMSSMTDEGRENQDITFQLNTSSHLKVKNYGNITEEVSEALVCVIPEDKKLAKTNIGKAFLDFDPYLQNFVSNLPFESNVEFMSYSSANRSTCRGIVFVILSRGLRPDQFVQTIQQILMKVDRHGLNSVSFPPLGHGRALKYDEDFIAKYFFSALVQLASNVKRTALRKINFLAKDKGLYFRMRQEGEKYFQPVISDTCGRRSNENWLVVKEGGSGEYEYQPENLEIRIVHKKIYSLASSWKTKLEYVCVSSRNMCV